MILVTGATGFLGSHVVRKLATVVPPREIVCLVPQGATVRVAGAGIIEQRLLQEYRQLGVTVHPYPAWGTVEDYQKAFETFGAIDTVLYLAANNNRSLGTDRLFRDNVETLERFITALGTRLTNTHFIFASSVMAESISALTARYGRQTALKLNPYACTKVDAEALLAREQLRFGYRLLVLRFASIYGKESQWGLMKSVRSLAALSKRVPVPYFPGRAHIIHVDDVALALVKAVTVNLEGTFDLNAAPLLSVGELVERCAESEGGRAMQIRLPQTVHKIIAAGFGLGSRLGIASALQLQSLFTDIYVGHGTNALDVLSIQPRAPFASTPPLSRGVFIDSVAVIGASGFIGSRIVRTLANRGVRVRCGIHHRPLPLENFEDSNVEYVSCDTSDAQSLSSFIEGQRLVVYAGGLTTAHGKRTWEDYLQANVLDVMRVLSAMRHMRVTRLIFFASQAPSRGAYGLSKALGEEAVLASGLDYTILKPGLVVGDRGLVALLRSLLRLLPIFPIPMRSPTNTELVDVDTIAEVVADMSTDASRASIGARVYLGSSRLLSFTDLVRTIATITERKRLFVPLPRWVFTLVVKAGKIVAWFPFTSEMYEGIFREKDAILPASMRLADEDPEAILRRHIKR